MLINLLLLRQTIFIVEKQEALVLMLMIIKNLKIKLYILELIFILSNRINDLGYITSRNPRDLDLLSKLYSEEVAKTNQ
jgi:hypothetical protein